MNIYIFEYTGAYCYGGITVIAKTLKSAKNIIQEKENKSGYPTKIRFYSKKPRYPNWFKLVYTNNIKETDENIVFYNYDSC